MSSKAIRHLCTLDKSSPDFIRSLYTFVRLDEQEEYSRNLQQSESARLVDFLDGALDVIPVTDALFRRCLRTLRFICANHNVFPSSHIMREGLKKTGDNPVAFGGFADVWEGTYGGKKVCVKALRIYNVAAITNTPKNAVASFHEEAVVWKRLRHPNVVGFLGVTTAPLQIVLEWMPNGTLTDYVNSHPQVDRIGLLLDVSEGVNYLHNCHMSHGDLKGPNILIDGDGSARVSDFGLSSIAHGKYSTGVKSDKGHTVRWPAPEVLFGTVPASKQADMFAFGMVVVEVFTGKAPFHDIISTAVSYKTMSGERPTRPRGAEVLGLSDALWRMAELCWQYEPKDPLKAPEVVDLLREIYATSSNNPFLGFITNSKGLGGSCPITPQTNPALPPKLLEILQYREASFGGALSSTPSLNSRGKTTTGTLPKRLASPRPKGVDQGWDGQHSTLPFGSKTLDPAESGSRDNVSSEAWSITTLPTLHQRNSSQVPEPGSDIRSPTEIPGISVQTANSTTSDASSFTVVGGLVEQHRDKASRGKHDGSDGQETYGMRDNCGATNTRTDRGDSGAKRLREPEPQQPKSSGQKLGTLDTLGPGGESTKPPTRSTTPTGDLEGDTKGEGGGETRSPETQQSGATKRGSSGWVRVRVMTKVMGFLQRVQSQSNETRKK